MNQRSVLLVVGLVAGGAGRHVHELAAGLSELGWAVRVACPADVADRYDFATLGVEIVPVEIGDRPRPLADVAALRVLHTAARDVGVVHAHGIRAGALAALAIGKNERLAVTLHNAAPIAGPQRAVFRLLERLVARRADVVLGVSADLLEGLRRRGATDIRVAVVAAARPRGPVRPPAEVRHEFGDPSVLALTVGRLAPQKDLGLLLDAVGQIDPALGITVLVAGDGPQRSELAARIATECLPVRLLGSRNDIPDLLAAADLVISSARWEGQPVWLQEAMHAGRPAVVTAVGGNPAIVGNAGLTVPSGDATALGAAVERLVRDSSLRESLREQAEVRRRALPDRDDAVAAAVAVYDDLRYGLRAGRRGDDVG